MDVKRNDVLAFHEAFLEKAAAEQGTDPHPAQPDRAAMLDAAERMISELYPVICLHTEVMDTTSPSAKA